MKLLILLLLCVAMGAQDAMETVKIQVNFTMSDGVYKLSDALYFTEAEYKVLTKETLLALQQERFDAYVASQEAQKVVAAAEPTAVDLEKQLADINSQIELLQKQAAELTEQIATTKEKEAAVKEAAAKEAAAKEAVVKEDPK